MTDWLGEARFILRGWRRSPRFTLSIVFTLALGLGLASAIFAFADGYLFRPLPFPGANRTYFVTDPSAKSTGMLKASDTAALRASDLADLGFVEWSSGNRVSGSQLMIGDRTVEFYTQEVTPGFRKTIALPLLFGRDFINDDHRAGDPVPVWLNYRFWIRELGGDRGVLEKTFRMASARAQRVVVVGVLAPTVSAFDVNNEPPDAIAPEIPPVVVDTNPNHLSYPLVRLRDGVTPEQAIAMISATLQGAAPAADGKPRAVRLTPLIENQVAGGRPTARVLFTGAMLVLLLAAITLVHLLLARGVVRSSEIATRAALGASRWRLVRLFLTESALLGVAGVTGGLILGAWLARIIGARIPQTPSNFRNLALVPMLFDARVIVFAIVLGAIVSVVGGLWPAWRGLRRPLTAHARSNAGITAAIPARLSRAILASEIAVATIVLVGTVFIGSGIWRYLHQPLGFDYEGRFNVSVDKSDGAALSPSEFESIRHGVMSVAGVRAAGPNAPVSIGSMDVPGVTLPPRALAATGATSGYFDALQLRLMQGRWFGANEYADGNPVAVVDLKAANLAWPGRNPIGAEVRVGGMLRQVVGVIEPVRVSLTRETAGRIYVPVTAADRWASVVAWAPSLSERDFTARVATSLAAVMPGARVDVRAVTFESLFRREVGEAEFQGPIMLAFGLLAFVLAGIGIFGLMAYLVERRTREFGIRLALGAGRGSIWRGVVRESVVPAAAGIALGLIGAWALESVVRAAVFGWQSSVPAAVSAVVVAMFVVAVLAASVPARRAMRIDPATTLRSE